MTKLFKDDMIYDEGLIKGKQLESLLNRQDSCSNIMYDF